MGQHIYCSLYLFNKAGAVVRVNPEDFEGFFVFGELLEITAGEFGFDVFFVGRIDKGDAGSFETCAGEAASPDTRQGAHDVVDGNKFGTATLVVVDAGFTTFEREAAEEFEVACFPGCHSLTNTAIFAVKMFGTACKTGRHGDAGLVEGGLRYVAQEGAVEAAEGLVSIGKHVPRSGLAFTDSQVVVAVDEVARQAREEDANLKVGHLGVSFDDAIFVGVAVEKQQSVFLSQGDAGLVEQSVVQADVLAFCLAGYLGYFKGLKGDAVGFGQGHHIGNQHGCTGRQTADGQRPLQGSLDAMRQFEAFAQGVFGSTGIVAPVLLAHLHRLRDIKLHDAFIVVGLKTHQTVLANLEPEVNAFVDGKACHQSVLVVNMGAKWTNAVGGEDVKQNN